mmetsp:Transcript_25358/g.39768  ORF Transcript_25358/g.39768 Transcript_25358/m.39768 type:complete len:245 (+) Transcript_25358:327-1061(+)
MRGGFDAFILGGGAPAPQRPGLSAPERAHNPGRSLASGPAKHHPKPSSSNYIMVTRGRGSCSRCRRLKLKCCENRPCKFCVMKNCGDSCVDHVPQKEVESLGISRAVGFQPLASQTTLQSYKPPMLKEELIADLFKGGCGYQKEAMATIFSGFTDDLHNVVHDTLGFMKGIARSYPAMFEYMMGAKAAPKAHELVGQIPRPNERFEYKQHEGEYSFFVEVDQLGLTCSWEDRLKGRGTAAKICE